MVFIFIKLDQPLDRVNRITMSFCPSPPAGLIELMHERSLLPMETPQTPYERFSQTPINVGRMNDPTGAAWIKGLCGDTMEIYLVINGDTIMEALFHTDGCAATYACGSLVTELAQGKSVAEALGISPKMIIDALAGLPEDHRHCAILAASTLHKAIADYLLRY
jgi:nitrogen fixation NifU-like protein